jgi:hypothetical protein
MAELLAQHHERDQQAAGKFPVASPLLWGRLALLHEVSGVDLLEQQAQASTGRQRSRRQVRRVKSVAWRATVAAAVAASVSSV